MKKISIIVPIYNEENYIKDCIESILNFDYPKNLIEVIFIDGVSEDKTVDILEEYKNRFQNFQILFNKKKIVPISMNIGIKNSTGDYICRLDAHAKYPVDYLSKLLDWSIKLDADNVGAVCVTEIKSQTHIAKSIQFVMSDKFGVGNSLFRVGVKEALEVDSVPFGFYKREVFDKIGFYNEKLVRVQDLELNKRLKKIGGKIFLVPDVKCTYFPREDLKSFFKNRFETGRWIILASYFTNSLKSISIRHLVPLFFSLSLILNLILGFYDKNFHIVFFVILLIYSSLLFFRGLLLKKNFIFAFNILIAYFTLHFSYGLGSFKGLFEILKGKFRN